MAFRPRIVVVLPLLTLLCAACVDPIDMTRPETERGTVGQELYSVLLRDLVRSPDRGPAKAAALETDREPFITAIDTLLPEAVLPDFEAFVLELLPLWDDNTLPDLVRKLAEVYEDLLADEAVREAWVHVARQREGYVHDRAVIDTVERLIAFPRLRDLAYFTTDLILAHDGVTSEGAPAPAEADYTRRLMRSVRDALRDPDAPDDIYRTAYLLGDLMLRPDERFVPDGGLPSLLAVRLDARGIVQGNAASRLFTDGDGDRLIDITADGAFLSRSNQPFRIAPYGTPGETFELAAASTVIFRDDDGRAMTGTGDFVYQYVDLNATPLGYLVRRTPELIREGVVNDTFIGLEGVLGSLTETEGVPHYGTDTAVLDVAEAAMALLDTDGIESLLEMAGQLLRDHEDTLATLMVVLDRNADISARYDAELRPGNTLVDDLLPFLYVLAQEKDLLDEIITALRNPVSREILPSIAALAGQYNDAVRPGLDGLYNTSVAACRELPVGTMERVACFREANHSEMFVGLVDHSLPEGPNNVSLAQRLMHLIHDGTDSPFDMAIEEATLLDADLTDVLAIDSLATIPDVAVAFFDSIAGNFCIIDYVNVDSILANGTTGGLIRLGELLGVTTTDPDDVAALMTEIIVLLSDNLGVHLDACPPPDQLLRFFNLAAYEMELGPVYTRLASGTCTAGYFYQEHHADALFAAEATGAIDALQPLLKVLSDRGLTPLFADFIRALYRHYPTEGADYRNADGSAADLAYSGIRTYEGAMREIMADPAMTDILVELLSLIQDMALTSGDPTVEPLQSLLLHALEPTPGLSTRSGIDTATRGDGTVTEMTRFYLLAESADALDAQLDADPEAQEAWERSSDVLVDLLLETREEPDGRGAFVDRGAAALGTAALEHASSHFRRHRVAGDLTQLLTADYLDELESLVTSRGLHAVLELVADVRANPEDQALFDELLLYLTEEDEATVRAALAIAYTAIVGTTDRASYPPIAAFFAEVLDPDRRFAVDYTADLPLATHIAQIMREALDRDEESITIDLLARGLIAEGGADAPFTVLGRVIRQINRLEPDAPEDMTVADLEALYEAIATYIRDDRKGLERAFTLVQERSGEQR